MDPSVLGQYVANGLMLGVIYAMVAVGFTLFFGVLDVIKFSHGDVLMVGAFAGLATFIGVRALGIDSAWLQLAAVVIVATASTAVLGAVIGKVLVLPLRSAPPLNTLLVTLMLGLALRELVRLFYPQGANPKPFPRLLPQDSLALGSFSLRLDNALLLAGGLAAIVAVHFIITRTRLGLAVRAVAQDAETARVMGIDFERVVLATFALGSGLAALAGVMNGLYYNEINFGIGLWLGVIGFSAAVVGGLGNIYGAILLSGARRYRRHRRVQRVFPARRVSSGSARPGRACRRGRRSARAPRLERARARVARRVSGPIPGRHRGGARRDPRAFLPRALSDADARFRAALHRGLPRAHGAVRLCRRGELCRRRLLRHRRVYLRSVGGPSVASARRARGRRHGGARGVVADSAGAAHARPLRSARHRRLRSPLPDLHRGERCARRPSGPAGQGHESLLLGLHLGDRDRLCRDFVLHELRRARARARRARVRGGAAPRALLGRPQSGRGAPRRDRERRVRHRRRALENPRLHAGQLHRRSRRLRVRDDERLRRAEQLHLRRLAHSRLDPHPRGPGQSLGRCARRGHRGRSAGKAPGAAGIPAPVLRRAGDRNPALPARRIAAAPG